MCSWPLPGTVALIFRHPLADMAAKAAAAGAALFPVTGLGSLSGASPRGGTWWVWGRPCLAVPVLMRSPGYAAVWNAFDDPHRAAALARVVALVGVINIPIVSFSVDWWNTLHQPASVFKVNGPSIDASMLWPLLLMALAYTLLFIALHLVAMASEIAARKARAARRNCGAR